MTPLQHYKESVTNALAGYQLLEGLLKFYAATYYDAVRAFLPGDLLFDFHRKDIEDAPLGRLITGFARTCSNKQLVADLRELKSHRDQVAHKALLCTLEETSDETYHEMIRENHKIIQDIGRLQSAVLGEAQAVGEKWRAALAGHHKA